MRVYWNFLIFKLFYFVLVVPGSWQCDKGVQDGTTGKTYKIIEESPTNFPGCKEVDIFIHTLNKLCGF